MHLWQLESQVTLFQMHSRKKNQPLEEIAYFAPEGSILTPSYAASTYSLEI